MNNFKFEQRRLTHRGREFHFVSYDAHPANERRGEIAMPPMWYLMNEGKRRPVMEQVTGMPADELDQALVRWIDAEVYGALPRRVAP